MTAAVLAATGAGLWPSGELAGRAVLDVLPWPDGGWRAVADGSVWGPGGVEVGAAPAGRCLVAAGPDLLVGTDEAHLIRVGEGVVESFEAADGRSGWYTPWGGPPAVRSASGAADGAVYVNVHVGGIVRSLDGGESWTPTIDVDSDVHEVLALDGGRVVAATGAYGLAVSADRGETWEYVADGLHGDYCRAVAVSGDWLLVSASTGPSTQRGAVYRRPLDAAAGVAFERCSDWFAGNVDTGSLAGDGSGAAALASPDGTIYVSDDAGASWHQVVSGLGRVNRLLLLN